MSDNEKARELSVTRAAMERAAFIERYIADEQALGGSLSALLTELSERSAVAEAFLAATEGVSGYSAERYGANLILELAATHRPLLERRLQQSQARVKGLAGSLAAIKKSVGPSIDAHLRIQQLARQLQKWQMEVKGR